jgi:hypothetical protein
MAGLTKSSPPAGRWQREALTEGAFGLRPRHACTPLHHRYAAVPLPASGEDMA